MRWSVAVEAEGDRILSREEIVDLADAVAPLSGIAAGIGSTRYGAQLIVDARTESEALSNAREAFADAAAAAGLPPWPIVRAEATGEDEDEGELR
jgi:hypothetical protein